MKKISIIFTLMKYRKVNLLNENYNLFTKLLIFVEVNSIISTNKIL